MEGEDVLIESSWRMLVDISPPPLGRVDVAGELKFEDERNYNFTAALVSVCSNCRHFCESVLALVNNCMV